jgi:hypothetical protein
LETLGGIARTGVAHYRSLGDESWPRALITDKPSTQLAEQWRLAGDRSWSCSAASRRRHQP